MINQDDESTAEHAVKNSIISLQEVIKNFTNCTDKRGQSAAAHSVYKLCGGLHEDSYTLVRLFQNEKEIAKINEAYHERIVATVGLRKTAKLYMSEMHFQRKLIERSRRGKGNGERGGPPPPRD